MIGTADTVDVWLMLEYRPVWKARALEQSDLGEDTRSWLERSMDAFARAGLKARPQLIRRPEIDTDDVHLFIGTAAGLLEFSGRGYDFLDALDPAGLVARPPAAARVDRPRYFVCTNGQRDLCCARFGLPVYAGLRERVGDRVWQVTHLGGHRFAPNVLVLPQGGLYGRVEPERLDVFVERVEAGELDFETLRGRTWLPPAAQAAEVLSRRQGLRLEAVDEDEQGATVRFRSESGPLSVRVDLAPEPMMVHKSCRDETDASIRPFLPG